MTEILQGPNSMRLGSSAAIETHTGILFDVANPTLEHITLDDIAHHLANVCRFGGACDPFYSVAEHSSLVHDLVAHAGGGKKQKLAALFHDAHEYVLGDIPSPLKPLYQPALGEAASRIDALIAELIGIKVELFKDPLVKEMDDRAMVIEAARVKHGPYWAWAKSDPLALLPWGGNDWRPRYPAPAFLGRAAALDVYANSNSGGVK
jgi:hypothetical protein